MTVIFPKASCEADKEVEKLNEYDLYQEQQYEYMKDKYCDMASEKLRNALIDIENFEDINDYVDPLKETIIETLEDMLNEVKQNW